MQSDDPCGPLSRQAAKRLVVYDPHDRSKWLALDVSGSQSWELEGYGTHWLPIDEFWEYSHQRTLYRLANKTWVLVDVATHFEGFVDEPTYEVITGAQAAEKM